MMANVVITPDEARALMPRNETIVLVEKVAMAIERAARNDKDQARVDFLSVIKRDTVELTPAGQIVAKQYEDRGFRFLNIYGCGQFVDVGIAISWKETP